MMTNRVWWSVATAVVLVVPSACTESKASDDRAAQIAPADTTAKLPKGIPEASAFFAATKVTGQCPNDTTCVYTQTFLNGMSRQITLVVSPNREAPPASEAIAPGEFVTAPISGFKIASDFKSEPATVNLNYYVAAAGLPSGGKTAVRIPRNRRQQNEARLANLNRRNAQPVSFSSTMQAGGGAGIAWGEVGSKGADATIGAMIDAATGKEIPGAKSLGSIYAFASALSDISTAAELGRQNTRWLKELDALEKCAGDPSNPVSRTDLNYSSRTVAKIQAARSELKEVSSVRFLNQLTEKGADLTPVTAVMAVGLKQGFVWSDQTLANYSENTIMREARDAVVKCTDPGNPNGNLVYTTTCNMGPNDVTVTKIVANVSWEWQMGVKYLPRGAYKYEAIRNIGGKCTEKSTGQGSLDNTGYLFIFDDPAIQKQNGYGYEARFVNLPTLVTTSSNCRPGYQLPVGIDFIPIMHGFRGTGGDIEGAITPKNACSPSLKWEFHVPPGK